MKKIKIVDTSTLVPGPFASYLLSKHLDCDVIKIEDINNPDPLSHMRPTKKGIGLAYVGINRSKKTIRVDYRNKGIEEVYSLIQDADIFVENFKEGKVYKLGLAYDDLKKINPKLIYCSIKGYGKNSKLAGKSAHDLNILSVSGYLDQQIKLGVNTVLPPLLLADTFTAYHMSLLTMSALIQGKGKEIPIIMLDAFIEAMTISNYPQIELKNNFEPRDYLMAGNLPCYGIYATKDKRFVTVAAIEKPLWVDFCDHLNRSDLTDKQFDSNTFSEISAEISKYNQSFWVDKNLDFCVTPVLSINEAIKYKYV